MSSLAASLRLLATGVVYPNVTNVCEGEDHGGVPCQALTEFKSGYIYQEYAAGKFADLLTL